MLADCLCHAVAQGAERIVDLATLTGAVIVALGSTYAGLMSNDDELAGADLSAGEQTGEIVWRLPLHEEYDELIKGTYGDLDNAPEARKAGTIVGGAFLSNFVGEMPWAHLDIAGSAWDLGPRLRRQGRLRLRRAPAGGARALLLRLAARAATGSHSRSSREDSPAVRQDGAARIDVRAVAPSAPSSLHELDLAAGSRRARGA